MLTEAMGKADELAAPWKRARLSVLGHFLKAEARDKPELDLIDAENRQNSPRYSPPFAR